MNEKIHTSKAPEPVGLYPHARRVGNLLFLSGVGPRKGNLKDIPGVNIDDQNLFISLLRQEFLKNGLILGSTFNLCYEHSHDKIFDSTIVKFDNSLASVKTYINSKNPSSFLKGDLIQTTFKVRSA